jgi:hypothetical protein
MVQHNNLNSIKDPQKAIQAFKALLASTYRKNVFFVQIKEPKKTENSLEEDSLDIASTTISLAAKRVDPPSFRVNDENFIIGGNKESRPGLLERDTLTIDFYDLPVEGPDTLIDKDKPYRFVSDVMYDWIKEANIDMTRVGFPDDYERDIEIFEAASSLFQTQLLGGLLPFVYEEDSFHRDAITAALIPGTINSFMNKQFPGILDPNAYERNVGFAERFINPYANLRFVSTVTYMNIYAMFSMMKHAVQTASQFDALSTSKPPYDNNGLKTPKGDDKDQTPFTAPAGYTGGTTEWKGPASSENVPLSDPGIKVPGTPITLPDFYSGKTKPSGSPFIPDGKSSKQKPNPFGEALAALDTIKDRGQFVDVQKLELTKKFLKLLDEGSRGGGSAVDLAKMLDLIGSGALGGQPIPRGDLDKIKYAPTEADLSSFKNSDAWEEYRKALDAVGEGAFAKEMESLMTPERWKELVDSIEKKKRDFASVVVSAGNRAEYERVKRVLDRTEVLNTEYFTGTNGFLDKFFTPEEFAQYEKQNTLKGDFAGKPWEADIYGAFFTPVQDIKASFPGVKVDERANKTAGEVLGLILKNAFDAINTIFVYPIQVAQNGKKWLNWTVSPNGWESFTNISDAIGVPVPESGLVKTEGVVFTNTAMVLQFIKMFVFGVMSKRYPDLTLEKFLTGNTEKSGGQENVVKMNVIPFAGKFSDTINEAFNEGKAKKTLMTRCWPVDVKVSAMDSEATDAAIMPIVTVTFRVSRTFDGDDFQHK